MFCKVMKGNEGTWMGKRIEIKGNKEGAFQSGWTCFARWFRKIRELGWENALKPMETKREHVNGG